MDNKNNQNMDKKPLSHRLKRIAIGTLGVILLLCAGLGLYIFFGFRVAQNNTRQAMERFFAEHGIAIRHGMQMTRNEAIKQAVRAGLGLSVVSMHTIELEIAAHKLVTLDAEGFPVQRYWYLVYRRGKRLSPAASAFRAFVLEEANRLTGLAPQPQE